MSAERFHDRHAIVTGAGAGIGRSIAHRLATEGARVVVADNNAEAGDRVAEEIRAAGGTAAFVDVDVSCTASVDQLVSQASALFGPVAVAVANAGVAESVSSALDITPEEWDRVYAVNARGAFFFCRACSSSMVDHGTGGAIVTVASLMARSGKGASGAYASSKASVVMFTKTLAKALAANSIRVNCVSPGVVATDIYGALEREMNMSPGTFVDWLIGKSAGTGQLLLPRKGEPEDIAAAVAFLASDEASYITAQNLSVDGGMDWCW